MNRYYLIGDPVSHSLSPAIHTKLYELYGIGDAAYGLWRVGADSLDAFMRSLPPDLRGLSVTMPHKTNIIPYMKATDGSVVNSVNTVVVKEDGLYGYSTDARGFYAGLLQKGFYAAGKSIVFIGAGGATAPLVDSAKKAGAKSVTVLNRTLQKARALAGGVVRADTLQSLPAHLGDCDLLVNTTSLGMEGSAQYADFSFLDALKPSALVCDLIYSPAQTEFLRHAGRRGHAVMNGLPMLIWQAFYAFDIFFGVMPGAREYGQIEAMLQACVNG